MKKLMREHHPMRYNRMTEILKIVAQGILMTFREFHLCPADGEKHAHQK